MERRVFVSATSDQFLDKRRRQLKAAIIQKVREAGYAPQEFWEMGIADDLPWTFDNVDYVMRQCIGAIVIGFPRWVMSGEEYTIRMVGEYNHHDGAVAVTLGLPLLIIAEEGVEGRGIVGLEVAKRSRVFRTMPCLTGWIVRSSLRDLRLGVMH